MPKSPPGIRGPLGSFGVYACGIRAASLTGGRLSMTGATGRNELNATVILEMRPDSSASARYGSITG